MSNKKTLDWLIKKVNFLLDQGCGCDTCSGGAGITPLINLGWGRQDNGDVLNNVEFVRKDTILNEDINIGNQPIEVDKLIVDVPEFESLAEYEPTLLVDRYSPRKYLGSGKWRKSRYRHEELFHANLNGRVTEFPLNTTGERTICDLKQENYFRVNGSTPALKGIGKKYKTRSAVLLANGNGAEVSYIYLGFRLRLTIDSEVKETGHFAFLKLTFFQEDTSGGSGESFQGLVRFSWA